MAAKEISFSLNPYGSPNMFKNDPHFNLVANLPNMKPKIFCHGPQQGFVQAHGPHLINPHFNLNLGVAPHH